MSQLTLPPPGQPFDDLKRPGDDGSDRWSARDLMPHLGYARWADFQESILRAQVACVNAGNDPDVHFVHSRGATDPGATGQVAAAPRYDWHLTRFGSYLLAMNGDPRKEEIARAQMYFAVKTREAEVSQARPLSRKELLLQALQAEEALEAAELEAKQANEAADRWAATATERGAELELAAPKAESYDRLMNAEGLYSLATAAQALGMGRAALIALLGELAAIVIRPGHSDHLRPYSSHLHAGRFQVKLGTYTVAKPEGDEVRTSGTTYVTPKGLDWITARIRERKVQHLAIAF